ncbi:MAG: hypothetical protein AAF721_33735 [Myxococcota bacterium]
MSTGNDSQPRSAGSQAGRVVDGAGSWEDALRAGQREEGNAGSVDAELAVVHLLRHAAQPHGLAEGRLDAIWADVDPAGAGAPVSADGASAEPWWKRPWSWIGGTAVAAAAAAVVLVVVIPKGPAPEGDPEVATAASPTRATQAELIEQQFALLAPGARKQVIAEVDESRDTLRGDLLADAVAAAGQSADSVGGAP